MPSKPRPRRHVLVIRHGQTEWSLSDQHTSRTDIDLTVQGEEDARSLRGIVERTGLDQPYVIASPRRRAQRTAALAGLRVDETSELFTEWDYGAYEGLTRKQIQADDEPGWAIWTHGARGGESVAQMTARVDRAVRHVEDLPDARDVVIVSHGHFSRAFICRFLGWPIVQGANIDLRPAGTALLVETDSDRRLCELHGPAGQRASSTSI
ncbi:histidine phosphatase family protein [Gordonia sp. X0973]|uniref:histidine phosphatase family protein n=1 Tax=Gordonia sp. X0973 TaxID=2742602 RepID=UPI000F52DEE8|nr:histidine phosphatase family protein [Gordonia sp. X0973]QKT06939.1 histidine phosphatase family protein [Gordonia sp. X0973]